MILLKILSPILSWIGKLILGGAEDLTIARNKYYYGSKVQSGVDRALEDTRGERMYAKAMAKGFIQGLNEPVTRRKYPR
jgi:hypothetical protein